MNAGFTTVDVPAQSRWDELEVELAALPQPLPGERPKGVLVEPREGQSLETLRSNITQSFKHRVTKVRTHIKKDAPAGVVVWVTQAPGVTIEKRLAAEQQHTAPLADVKPADAPLRSHDHPSYVPRPFALPRAGAAMKKKA